MARLKTIKCDGCGKELLGTDWFCILVFNVHKRPRIRDKAFMLDMCDKCMIRKKWI